MLQFERVEVAYESERKAPWEFAGKKCRGIEVTYFVRDANYASRNQWTFVVRTPNFLFGNSYIEVRPIAVPNRKDWGGLDRKALLFRRSTIGNYRGKFYCKLAALDEDGAKSIIRERSEIPKWIKGIKIVAKRCAIRSKGTDEGHPVAVVRADDHPQMIRLFLALKPWVCIPRSDPNRAKRTGKRQNKLKGMKIAVTGKLGFGNRSEVQKWLRKLGAIPQSFISNDTSILLKGAHPLEDDRRKVAFAEEHGIAQLSEYKFRNRFSV